MDKKFTLIQVEGAFVQGIGFFMSEEYLTNLDGLVVADSTWTYKIPTIDTIPRQFNVEVLNSGHHEKRVLSSKGMYALFTSSKNSDDFVLYLAAISQTSAQEE